MNMRLRLTFTTCYCNFLEPTEGKTRNTHTHNMITTGSTYRYFSLTNLLKGPLPVASQSQVMLYWDTQISSYGVSAISLSVPESM
jgi:hypothetical protein